MEVKYACGELREKVAKERDYKAVRLQSLYYAAFFQDNLSLIDYVNSQPLSSPLGCLGDGHDGIWNLIAEFSVPENRYRDFRLVSLAGKSL